MNYASQNWCDKTMDKRMALYREQWDLSNMTKHLFGIGFDMLFSKLYKIMVMKLLSYVLVRTTNFLKWNNQFHKLKSQTLSLNMF